MSRSQVDAIWVDANGNRWWIGICNGCQRPVLVLNHGAIIFPNPLPKPIDERIPKPQFEELREAKMCFYVKCYRASAAMARRCVESTCVALNAEGKNLHSKIADLGNRGVITKEMENWATLVRYVGNDAVHPENDEVTREDAENLIHFTEQLLQILFVAPQIAREMMERRRGSN